MKYLKSGDLISIKSEQYAEKIWPFANYVIENYENGYIKIKSLNDTYIVREEECELIRPWEEK